MGVERGPVTGVKRHLFPPPTILKQKEKARTGTSCIILHTVQEPQVRQVSRDQASCPEDKEEITEIKDQGKGARERVLVGNVGKHEKWEKSAANRVYERP